MSLQWNRGDLVELNFGIGWIKIGSIHLLNVTMMSKTKLLNSKGEYMSKEKKVVLTCPHCSNKTPMNLLNEYCNTTTELINGFEFAEFAEFDTFEVFECPVCKGIQLYHTYWNSEEGRWEDYDIYEDFGQVLFPKNEGVDLLRLPDNIKSAYESALRVKNIDNTMCVMGLRRALEMMCKDNGAVKGALHQKLNQLQQEGILPPLMGDISKVIKDFGNMAAHGDQVEFDKKLVESMFRFTNKILEYVYILPKEMKRARLDIEKLSDSKTD